MIFYSLIEGKCSCILWCGYTSNFIGIGELIPKWSKIFFSSFTTLSKISFSLFSDSVFGGYVSIELAIWAIVTPRKSKFCLSIAYPYPFDTLL